MPRQKRVKTRYPGVYYVDAKAVGASKAERIYYIMYRRDGKLIEEKAGRQYQDKMSAAKAAALRVQKIEGSVLSNQQDREAAKAQKEAEEARWTFGRIWEAYVEAKPDLKGLAQDRSRWRKHLEVIFGDKEPHEIIPLDLDRLRVRLQKKYAPQTVKACLALLRRLVKWGSSRGFCQPLSFQIEMPKVNNQVTEDLTQEQLTRLLEAIENDPHPHAGPLMKLALYTGMRKSELLRLRWDDLDFKGGHIRIIEPKGGRDQIIPMNSAAKEVLIQHQETRESDFVFPGREGGRRVEIRRPIERIRKEARLPEGFRPLHGLRHVFATTLASSGEVDMYTLQRLLTHKNPETTQRYAHLRDQTLRKASELGAESFIKAQQENGSTKPADLATES